MAFDTSKLKSLILKRLNSEKERFQKEFQENGKIVGTRFLSISDLLPNDIALEISKAFTPESSAWREMDSFRERKLTSKQYDSFPKILGEITFAFQEPEIIKLVEEITQIKNQVGDPGLYAGGLSIMRDGDFLNPHIDNSHDQDRKYYRRLNLLYYVTPNWNLQDGGHLELWDEKVKNRVVIESKFNTLVLMETDHQSWHSVCKVNRVGGTRCCVSNYYFSPDSPLGHEYFHITAFKGRPDEPFKRFVSDIDSVLRRSLRFVKRTGFGKKDTYGGNRPHSQG